MDKYIVPGLRQTRYLRILAKADRIGRSVSGSRSLTNSRIASLESQPTFAADRMHVQPAMEQMKSYGWVEPGEPGPRGGRTWQITEAGLEALEIAESVR